MFSDLSFGRVLKSSVWLYIGGLLFSFLGYCYLLVASFFVNQSDIGFASAVVAFQSLLLSLTLFGVPMGLRRFLGLTRGIGNYQRLSSYFFTALVFDTLLNLPLVVLFLFAAFTSISIINFSSFALIIIALLHLLGFWPTLIYPLFDTFLKTEYTAKVDVASSIMKLIIGVSLLTLGYALVGLMWGFISAFFTRGVLIAYYARKLFRENDIKPVKKFDIAILKNLLKAGFPSWVPSTLAIIGQSVSVLIIFALIGGAETGLYYLAFAIALIAYKLPDSLQSLMLPHLSGKKSGKKRASLKAIRISFTITVPVCLILAVYSYLPFGLLGPNYAQASSLLTLLVIGALFFPIISGYISFIYAVGKYVHVFMISIVMTVSRLVLYLLLVLNLEATGVAIAYTLGIFCALVPLLISANRMKFSFNWRHYIKALSIPSLFAVILFVLNIFWFIGIPLLLIVSLVSNSRLGVITKEDLLEVAQAFMSKESISRLYPFMRPGIKILFGGSGTE